jgi:hypothetical protein
MASALYPITVAKWLDATGPDLIDHNIKVILIDVADYTYSAAHDFLDDVAAAARVATTANLAGKSVTDGIFDAADSVFTAVVGDPCEALIIYRDTGVEATSELVAYIDGISVTPNGNDIDLIWSNGANKIFKIG